MPATTIYDKVKLTREQLLRCILYIKVQQLRDIVPENIKISENDLKVCCLFLHTTDKEWVIRESIERKYVKTWQSGENSVTRLVKYGLLEKPEQKKRVFGTDIFPNDAMDDVAAWIALYNVEEDAAN